MNTNTKFPAWVKPVLSTAFPNRIQLSLVVALAGFGMVLMPRSADATIYYYDNDSSNPGFGTAGGTWAVPTPGPIPGWTTDATGSSIPGSITTLTTDTLNFGNGATGLGAGTITLSGAVSGGSISFAAGSGPISLSGGTSLTLAASPTITTDNSSDTIATPIAGAGTTFTKAGLGTLVLSGANTMTGAVTVNSGELQLNGVSLNIGAKVLSVASGNGQTAVFNIANGSFTNSASNPVGSGATNAVGVIKMTGGNFIMASGNLNLSGGAAGRTNYGAFLMSGGTAFVGTEFDMARDSATAYTYVNIAGGSFACSNFATVGREGLGVLDISGGTFLRPTAALNRLYMGRTAGSFSQLTVRGTGTIDFEDNGFFFANSLTPVFSGFVNLMPGGKLTSRVGIFWNANGSSVGHFSFNGGTLQASGSSANFWTNGWTACYVYSGGATVDSQANNITIGQPFLVPTGSGVTSITGGASSGFLASPVVIITDAGSGTGATAIAQINSSGVITNMLISNPGVNYSSATVTFFGGGGTASGWNVNLGANATTGGLTKLGSGVLTMGGLTSGPSTYQGPTKVGGGTLAISAGNYPPLSALTLSNSTAMNIDVSGGATTFETPSLTLQANTTLNLSYGGLAGNPFQPAISDASINTGTALTASGTNIVINLSGSGFVSGQFPIIKYSGSIGGNGFSAFKIGTRPSGVPATAQLVNNTTSHSIDLLIPPVNTLTWNGTNSNWDTNTINWKDTLNNSTTYKEYGTSNLFGDLVTFDDSLSDPTQTNINLTTTLHPSSVTVAANSSTYVFGGAGKLSGASFLSVTGGGTLIIDTANDYTGGDSLTGGTVLVGNDAALGTGPVILGGSLLSSDSATARSLANAVSITVDSTFGTAASSGALTFSGPVDLGAVARGLTFDNSVAMTGPTSNGGITKAGNGTLTIDNPSTLLTQPTTVFGGGVALNSGIFTGTLNIAPSINQIGIVSIANANITNTGISVALGANSVGIIKQSGGNMVESGTASFGNSPSGSAAYLMTGGFASFGGDTRLDNNGAVGLISQSGGNMVSMNFFTIARDGGVGVYDLSGGTHFRPASSTNQFYLGSRAANGTAQVTLRGTGTLDIEDNDGLWFDRAGDRTQLSFGTVNILSGGTLITRAGIQWGNTNPSSVGYVNFNGGTLRASGSTSAFWSGWTAGYIFAGGANIDTQGNSITIGQAILSPSGSGVTSITGGSGSGYLAPPVVVINGDGTGAAAVAQIDSGGNITGILVTSPGVNYTSASVSLVGGGGVNSVSYNANIGANVTTGTLTKLGTGILTLTGSNTYNGATVVSNGKLLLGTAHAATGNVTVADGATLGCLADVLSATVNLPNATLGVTTGAGLLAQFTGNTGNPTTPAGFITNLTLNGPTAVSVACNGIQVGTIPLFQYTTLSGSGTIIAGVLPQGVVGTITNNTATKTISLVVSGFTPLIWTGANGSNWDIGVTTNWVLGATPTAYQDGASVTLFNDSAITGNITIAQSVNPGSLVFSNNTVTYDVGTGTNGVLNGGTGVTKSGTGTVMLSGTNNYTGPTTINNGTLQIGDGGAGGTLNTASTITVGGSGTLGFNTSTTLNGIANNISGTGTVNKDGAQMGWTGSNSFSGTINVVGGKLAFSSVDSEDGQPNVNIASGAVVSIGASFAGTTATLGNLTGAGAIDVAFGATTGIRTMQVNQTTDGVYSGPMTDSSTSRFLALVKTGPAKLTLSGANVFTGGTIVSNGTLLLNGSMTSNSLVTVNSGAAFGGSGTADGIVSFSAGSIATNIVGAPLTVSTLDMAGNATMNVGTAFALSAGSYPLINYTTLTSSGQFTSFTVGGAGLAPGATASVVIASNTVSLNVVGGSLTPANITSTLNGNQLVLNWPSGQGWLLQGQTNGPNLGLTTNWVTVSNATPPFTNTVSPANPSVFFRLKH